MLPFMYNSQQGDWDVHSKKQKTVSKAFGYHHQVIGSQSS